jgi:N-carbamoylputrescine amidase
MNTTHFALIQLPWLDSREQMVAAYRRLIPEAAKQGATLIGLQEFSLSPYLAGTRHPDNFQWAEARHGGETDLLMGSLAKEHNLTIISSIFERRKGVSASSTDPNDYLDAALIHTPDGVLAYATEKMHIPSGDGYHETDYFVGGDYQQVRYPVHALGDVAISTPTCYDQWFPEVARMAAIHGAELIFYPTAIGSEPNAPKFDSKDAWQTVMRGHAVANGVFVAAANRVGNENGVTFYGSSFIADPGGNILAEAPRDKEAVIVAVLEQPTFDQWRHLFPLLRQRRPDAYGSLTDAVRDPLDDSHWDNP